MHPNKLEELFLILYSIFTSGQRHESKSFDQPSL